MAYIVKVESGKAKVYEGYNVKRVLGSGVTDASCNDEWVVTVEKGKVKQYSIANGNNKRTFPVSDAVSVNISGDSIVIGCANGKSKEYSAKSGSHKRTF